MPITGSVKKWLAPLPRGRVDDASRARQAGQEAAARFWEGSDAKSPAVLPSAELLETNLATEHSP